MARVRSVDFLPEIFKTDANKQFLSATLDNLIQEPKFKKTQGFIGRTVGPGVNPNDKYVVEPSQSRTNYQLEPGVVSLDADTHVIKDALTYPGFADAINFQGGNGELADRLYQSDYYTFDPFIDLDSFTNFSEYYWLPNGPDAVDVQATGVPVTDSFTVTRENGVYTFSGVNGTNPILELVRGGSYTFNVAQNAKETINYRVTNQNTSAYIVDYQNNPTLTLVRGNTYVFNLTLRGDYPFWIKTAPTTGTGEVYNSGVSRNGSITGLVTFVVPQDAPDTLYYSAENQTNMHGTINVIDGTPGTGPGFWIQTDPGVSGKIPVYPNISSRDVYGVINNGEDLGQVIFNVPQKTAQQFYYDLPVFPTPVDLVTNLRFDQINNRRLDEFLAEFDGIDGVQNLNTRTLIFTNPITDAQDGGWIRTTFFDPLDQNPTNNGLIGSFDTTTFSQETEIPPEDRYQLWQVSYVKLNNITYLQLNKIANIDNPYKFTIRYGEVYSNTNWYKAPVGVFEQIPLLTSLLDTLYYQDGTDPEIFGRIKLLESTEQDTLFIDDILGKKNYTSPNGVTFTNGLKVVFRGDVVPASYSTGTYSFTCTATNSEFNAITTATTEKLYVGQEVIFVDPTLGGLIPGQTYYIHSIINQFQFTVSSVLGGNATTVTTATGSMDAVATSYREYYVAGVGTAIELLPVSNFVVPESYVIDANDSTILVEPKDLDYITIDRASHDLNAWTRSNRWFHSQVINATAEYNGTVPVFDYNYRARRPIIQFRPGIRLYNMGTEGKQPVDVIDFSATDAFSNIEGTTSYTVDGYTFVNGTRVVFAADADSLVRNKIWVVEFITPDSAPLTNAGDFNIGSIYTIVTLGTTDWNAVAGTTGVTYSVGSTFRAQSVGSGTGVARFDEPVINLTLAPDGEVLLDQTVVCLDTNTQKGKTFWYNGTEWLEAQQKTSVQQAPLFNVYDLDGVSFGDETKYPSSDFIGSKLFSYAPGDSGILDNILGFPLQYLNINNVGDIVFDNNLYKDTFVYTLENISTTLPISSGTPREYSTRTLYERLIGWQNAATTTKVYQQFKFTYTTGESLKLDVRVNDTDTVPVIKIYVGSTFQDPGKYTYTRTSDTTTITLLGTYVVGDIVEVLVLSDQTSKTGFYQVPINLQNNPLNANSQNFTLGTIRQHYQSICENLNSLVGNISGSNNTRDLGNILPYGLVILQQSSPLTLAGYFLRSQQFNIFNALTYNSREYTKFKNQMLEAVTQQVINFQTAAEILDTAIADITIGKVETQPFYWSDMLPSGAVYVENSYTVNYITSNVFDTVQVYNYTSANYLGMDVYLNNEILTRDLDYVVATDGPRITILTILTTGDVVTIREYTSTYGSFCPNTPTKLGLYPAWRPELTVQKTSTGIEPVIVGHDGSITKAFGDIRDDVLLEFETRIFNNLKLDGNPVPLTVIDVLPGEFRDTGYSLQEINNILNTEFLSYVAWNKLDYKQQDYQSSNEFTWNYSEAQSKLDNQNLLGAWRGIYRYYYDTQQPELTPWEMLCFSIKPDWWDLTYGTAPYTKDNLVLWDDLEAGYVRDPIAPYYKPECARPGLSKVIPTSDEGELLSPFDSVVGNYDVNQFRKSWSLGDGGPVEASWWNSSNYPFAVMRLLALTRPAKFFALFADRDLYRYNEEFNQYLYNDRYRLDAYNLEIYGNGVSKASYIDWIVDYNRQLGVDSTVDLTNDLRNIDVRLCYRMASFSDKQYIKIYTEKSSPNSTNSSFLIPDESYNLLLYKNQPFERASYSSVLIQQVSNGYAVLGYSTFQPYFNTLQSVPTGKLQPITVNDVTVRVPTLYSDNIVQVPYGYIFSDVTSVVDFLLSYGRYLENQGLEFTNTANGFVLDWTQMAREFMYWAQQGWDTNCIIAINPLALRLSVTREQAVVDSIRAQTAENVLLDQNRRELPTRNLNIVRADNTFVVEPLNDQTLSFIDLKYTSYEHMIVLDNASLFGDLIYDPTTGARQSRLNLIAVTTTEWNGSVDAQGFILNQNNVEEWTGLRTYAKGEIVKYKNQYWSAATIVQPSQTFNFNDWYQSDYTQIELGLLPNLANKANQLQNSYDINNANLEVDNDLLSYGLIGFRQRQYLTDINLDDVSQVNVYRQFLGTKGTKLATDLFRNVQLGKELAEYDIYENWAVQRAVYGANANRSYFELRLNRSLLSANPSVVQVVNPQETSKADQAILVSDIWKESFKITSPNILPTTTDLPTDISLPTAGYVNLDDVNVTVFDINDTAAIAAVIDQINVGTSVWVAKINDYDWGIYRAVAVPGTIAHVCDNLDSTSRAIFTKQHGLNAGERVIIRFFDPEVNGVYTVLSVPDLYTINIAFTFTGGRTVVNGTGLAFTQQTMRVAQASDVINLPYANTIENGSKIWVDNNGAGLWEVIEKQSVFTPVAELSPKILDATEAYGTSVAQALNKWAALVGSPRYGFSSNPSNPPGGVYVYVKNFSDTYQPISPVNDADAILSLSTTTGTRGYGASVAFGSQDWAAAGAPASLGALGQANCGYVCVIFRDVENYSPGTSPYANWQLITPPSTAIDSQGKFGYSIAISDDERWMYIGAPGINTVYAYGRVDWKNQYLKTVGNGTTSTYDFSGIIQVTADTQITVSVDGVVLTLGVDYTVVSDTVVFNTAPADGTEILIQRTNAVNIGGGVNDVDLGTYLYNVSTINSFSVEINSALQRPNIDYTFDEGTQVIHFASTPSVGATVLIRSKGYFQFVSTLTVPGLNSDAQFGYSVSCSTDGRQVLIGCPDSTIDGKLYAGSVYVFDRNVQKFIYQGGSDLAFEYEGTAAAPISVLVNNVFLINGENSIVGETGTFTWSGNTVTLFTDLNVGDVVDVEINQFAFVQKITQLTPAEYSNYGQAVDLCANNCSLYAGAPQSSLQVFKGGVVQRNVNQSRLYGTITNTVQNAGLIAGYTLRVNNIDVTVPASAPNIAGLASAIIATVPNVTATVSNGYLTITTINTDSVSPIDKLQVAPGSIGNTFEALGFDTFAYTQTILSPYPVEMAGFGASVCVDNTIRTSLAIGSPKGTMYLIIVFDNGTTEFDANATTFFSSVPQSGAVYTYDLLSAANGSVDNPDNFVFGNQIEISDIEYLDQLGYCVSYVSGSLWLGAPGSDVGDSSSSDYGRMFVFLNPTLVPAWQPTHYQQPTVDIRLINSSFLYDSITSATTEFLDFFNPLQGKILGAARQNIDYIGAINPAGYNVGPYNVQGITWGSAHVGEVWWDISNVRFIDPSQDDIVYAARRWGQVFPGSSIDVYQWIVSDVPPANYTGAGTPYSTVSYSVESTLGNDGAFTTQYYFWVRGLTTVATAKGKTLSVTSISNYIADPRSTGIAYLAPINSSTVALYNCEDLIVASDTILNIEFDQELTDDNVHVEYELVPQDRSDGFLSSNLYRKLLDSFCGIDTFGNLVPDINLSPAERYGVQFRPRQSMFVNRFEALRNYIGRANTILAQYPITESRNFNLLNSSEPQPSSSSGDWDKSVANIEALSYQNIYAVPLGYTYLVESDSTQNGLWTIYTVSSTDIPGERTLALTRVQNYYTPAYWSHINWYMPGYNSSIKPVAEVANYALLATLTVPVGSSVKVTANSQGKFEIYLLTDTGWDRVGLEDGTIEISAVLYDYALGRFGFDVEVFDAQYFDQEPVIETRKILQAINEELFIDDLEIERNRALVLMFNYILSESVAPEWLVKTSLIDVDHVVRELLPFQNYSRDNQEFVIDYIQEVKPYHVQIREFNLKYFGSDAYPASLTDFDLPAYFNTSLATPQYTSPILLPYNHGIADVGNDLSDLPATSTVWSSWPYSQWYSNYLLAIDYVTVIDGGSGYTEPPVVTFVGGAAVPATGTAIINSLGQVVAVNIITQGSGYYSAPEITFTGGNGSAARAQVVLIGQGYAQDYNLNTAGSFIKYNLTRSFSEVTLKFDRFQYQTQILTWDPSSTYENGTLVRYDNRVWRAENSDGSSANVGPAFNLEDWVLVPASELSGVDRTMGYYVAGVNSPGLELPLLVDGVDYPGVQVWGDYFIPIETNDADYRSSFTDIYLGTLPTDINVVGGEFIGPYEGHAPEELVNGSEYDTLDLRVYTRPGSDWQFDGHGFQIGVVNYIYDSLVNYVLSWANVVENTVEVIVSNQTTGQVLALNVDYTVNWENQTVEIIPGLQSDNDIINIAVYELGGGAQLYRTEYVGSEIVNGKVIIPVNSAEITNIAIFVDGNNTATPTWTPYYDAVAWSLLDSYEVNTVVINGSTYYIATNFVPVGTEITDTNFWEVFVPTLLTEVTFATVPGATDGVSLTAFGQNYVPAGRFIVGRQYTISTVGNTDWIAIGAATNEVGEIFTATDNGSGTGIATTEYSWSTPQTQYKVADAIVVANAGFTLTNSLEGTNPANMIVMRNGRRLTPPAGIEWFGDDTSLSFGLPQRMGASFLQSTINPITDIQVWVDNILQTQSYGAFIGDYSVTNWDGSNTPGRQVVFNTPPQSGARILIAVSTLADYSIGGTTLELAAIPNLGDVYSVITWNDTSQQNILTQIFVGPITEGATLVEPYDSTDFDTGSVSGDPGSFDYSAGTEVVSNSFELQRTGLEARRTWVTLDGNRLFEGQDYTIVNNYLILASGTINSSQILAVTEFTESVVPESAAFRIFQDMRGVQAVFRITNGTTTYLTQDLTATADVIYVNDASVLTEPNLSAGVFGIITIDGERIMYRYRDVVTNTISGLRRGTAGTAAASHDSNANVYDMGRGNLLPEQYQDYIVKDSTLADGTTTVFTAPSITDADFGDSALIFAESLEVYVGGTRQYPVGSAVTSQYPWTVTGDNPATIEFYTNSDPVSPVTPPPAGAEVTILQRRGTGWYGTGVYETTGPALQEVDTPQARFLCDR